MAVENKDEGKLPPSDASANREGTANEVLIGTTDDSSDIIYTPPDSISNMSPSTSGENTSSPGPSHTDKSTHLEATAKSFQCPSSRNIDGSSSNISAREYIYFLPYPLPAGTPIPYSIHLPHRNPLNLPSQQFEPTSTLVLTSPLRTFVDIRIYKPFSTPDASGANPGSSQRLEWAFAGTSTSVPKPSSSSSSSEDKSSGWENVTHSTWTHWLDSRFCVGDKNIPVDEGDMYPIEADLTLEVGHAFHPALDAVKTHEEMWRDEEAKATSTAGGEKGKNKVCVVLRCQDDKAGVRGVVVRVGQYVQGIVMQGVKTTVERWEWTEKEEGVGEWERSVRIGEAFLPCAVCFRGEVLTVGGKVRYGAFEWMLEEVWEWV